MIDASQTIRALEAAISGAGPIAVHDARSVLATLQAADRAYREAWALVPTARATWVVASSYEDAFRICDLRARYTMSLAGLVPYATSTEAHDALVAQVEAAIASGVSESAVNDLNYFRPFFDAEWNDGAPTADYVSQFGRLAQETARLLWISSRTALSFADDETAHAALSARITAAELSQAPSAVLEDLTVYVDQFNTAWSARPADPDEAALTAAMTAATATSAFLRWVSTT